MSLPAITDYLLGIDEYNDTGVCNVGSSDIAFEGSTRTISNPDGLFTCFRPGDYIFVLGSRYNDGFYTIASVNPYQMVVEESLTTEDSGVFVNIFEVQNIGQGQALYPYSVLAHGLPGVIGQGDFDLSALSSLATSTSGIHGRCEYSLEISASGDQNIYSFLNLPYLLSESSGISGFRGTCDLPALEQESLGSVSSAQGNVTLPQYWVTNDDSFYGNASLRLPSLVGGSYCDASIELDIEVQAEVESRVNGQVIIIRPEAYAWSWGDTAWADIPAFDVDATGATGAKALVTLPVFDSYATKGSYGGFNIPALESVGYDDVYAEDKHATADIELPLFFFYSFEVHGFQVDSNCLLNLPDFNIHGLGITAGVQWTRNKIPVFKVSSRAGVNADMRLDKLNVNAVSFQGSTGSAAVTI